MCNSVNNLKKEKERKNTHILQGDKAIPAGINKLIYPWKPHLFQSYRTPNKHWGWGSKTQIPGTGVRHELQTRCVFRRTETKTKELRPAVLQAPFWA